MMMLQCSVVGRVLLVFCALIALIEGAVKNRLKDEVPSSRYINEALVFQRRVWKIESTEEPKGWGEFEPMFYIDTDSDAEVAIGSTDNTIYMGFRGSDDSEDWWDNLDFAKRDFDISSSLPGKVHKGWYNKWFEDFSFEIVEDEIQSSVLPMIRGNTDGTKYRFVLTGYSQGGALAILYGAYLADRYPGLRFHIVTTGSPRVASPEWQQAVHQNLNNLSVHRIVFRKDIVPRSPPQNFDYRHVGHLIFYYDKTFKAYYQHDDEESSVYEGVPDEQWELGWDVGKQIEDHDEVNYQRSIQTAINYPSIWPTDFEKKELLSLDGAEDKEEDNEEDKDEDCCRRRLFICFCGNCC
mmetsp:Transcript_35065/g.49794  ORF Transcript_35065/g.49794 Transcript_35065/m.49794 type:complete len:352 (+) Transcript_35065:121-1176(+)